MSDLLCVGCVVVAVKHGVIGPGHRQGTGDLRIVVGGQSPVSQFQFRHVTVENHVTRRLSILHQEHFVPVIIAPYHVDRPLKTL